MPHSCTQSHWGGWWACGSRWKTPLKTTAACGSSQDPTKVSGPHIRGQKSLKRWYQTLPLPPPLLLLLLISLRWNHQANGADATRHFPSDRLHWQRAGVRPGQVCPCACQKRFSRIWCWTFSFPWEMSFTTLSDQQPQSKKKTKHGELCGQAFFFLNLCLLIDSNHDHVTEFRGIELNWSTAVNWTQQPFTHLHL